MRTWRMSVHDKSKEKQGVSDLDRAYQTLEIYGVPKNRAKSVSNGIQVLVSRMDNEIEFLKV
jgi:hypothetical protein